ncbi:UNVERIFIED_CONTAM: hypothetical protein KB574_08385 [Streptococcus canis]
MNASLGGFDTTDNDDGKFEILSKVNDDFAEFDKEGKAYTNSQSKWWFLTLDDFEKKS